MPEDTAEDTSEDLTKKITSKKADAEKIASTPDVCKTPSPADQVPIPYPNTAGASDSSTGSKKVKITGKPVLSKKKSQYKKSSGDEPGSADGKNISRVRKIVNLRIANVPLWIWGLSSIVLIVGAVWILLNSHPSLEPAEPIEFLLNHLTTATRCLA
jgi:hypothetical protein